jgi:thiol-disulfide isomerase/thioredoxin
MRHPRSWSKTVSGLTLLATVGVAVAALVSWGRPGPGLRPRRVQAVPVALAQAADPFDGAVAWLNCAGPIRLSELRGKVVLLDFWTYCCINCHHILPTLAKLEEKYKNELVVIGVHTPKFVAEQDTENIRQKVREYGIKHPVISDANMTIWNRFNVNSWPTLVLIDTDGNPVDRAAGEVQFEPLDRAVGRLVEQARSRGTLNETPVQFFPENEKPYNTPLLYPGKVLADAAGRRLFMADTGHNRVVITDLEGKNATAVGDGGIGLTDGPFERAHFNRPQGMCLVGQTLYVADTENHAVRAVDLKGRTVSTVAGVGRQSTDDPRRSVVGPGKTTALSSPWDLVYLASTDSLYIAMAGTHQIWKYELKTGRVGHYAGNALENAADGELQHASFAQPSGIATDGSHLFVADSEASAVRSIALTGHRVTTLAGTHDLPNGRSLFAFGDRDGAGTAARFQHCLGVAFGDGKVYVADTYNNKVKVIDPKTHAVKTLAGSKDPGDSDNPARSTSPAA